MRVDAYFALIATQRGAGSATQRACLLRELVAQATDPEQDFLLRLIVGDLRQGALEGVMVAAIAVASALPVADVRRAAMPTGGLGPLAQAALTRSAPGLEAFSLQLFAPVAPMLALDRAVPDALRFPQLVTTDTAAAQQFYDEAIAAGHDDVMAKSQTKALLDWETHRDEQPSMSALSSSSRSRSAICRRVRVTLADWRCGWHGSSATARQVRKRIRWTPCDESRARKAEEHGSLWGYSGQTRGL